MSPTFSIVLPSGWPTSPETLTAVLGSSTPDLVSCGGPIGFPRSVFDDPNPPTPAPGPQLDAALRAITVFGMDSDQLRGASLRLAEQDATLTTYLAKIDSGWIYVGIQYKDGDWVPAGMGDCHPTAVSAAGYGPASWALNPEYAAPSPDTTELQVLVWEMACSGGRPATGRMSSPIVDYGDGTLTMTISVKTMTGPQTCPGPPGTPAVVVLPQPLGNRSLLDGHTYPAQPPTPDSAL
jgi:hypothetical protein